MASNKNPIQGKNGKMARLRDLAKKGSDLWNEYGDVVKKGVVSLIKRDSNPDMNETNNFIADKELDVTEVQPIPEDNTEYIAKMGKQHHPTVEIKKDVETDTFFENQQSRLYDVVVKDTVLGGKLTDPQQCLAALNEIYSVADETIRYCEEQETKRESIRAERDVAIARIKQMGDLVKVYLEKTFDERLTLFSKQFEAIDVALSSDNIEMLAVTLNSMNALAASSPFKNLADINSVQQGLIEQSEWDI